LGEKYVNNVNEMAIGDEVDPLLYNIKYTVQNGQILLDEYKDDISTIIEWTYSKKLETNPSEHPVVIADYPLSSRQSQMKLQEIMFEKFKVPSLYIGNKSIFSLFSVYRLTGTIVDIGE